MTDNRRVRPITERISVSRLIRLFCGHTTHGDEQMFYSFWQPEGGLYYCDKCGIWCREKKEPENAQYGPDGWDNAPEADPLQASFR